LPATKLTGMKLSLQTEAVCFGGNSEARRVDQGPLGGRGGPSTYTCPFDSTLALGFLTFVLSRASFGPVQSDRRGSEKSSDTTAPDIGLDLKHIGNSFQCQILLACRAPVASVSAAQNARIGRKADGNGVGAYGIADGRSKR